MESELRFEWDPRKAVANRRKHGVSFNETQTVFADEFGLLADDHEHSSGEDRFILLGMSLATRLLVVVHCYRPREEVVRIISARKATPGECRQYEERWKR